MHMHKHMHKHMYMHVTTPWRALACRYAFEAMSPPGAHLAVDGPCMPCAVASVLAAGDANGTADASLSAPPSAPVEPASPPAPAAPPTATARELRGAYFEVIVIDCH